MSAVLAILTTGAYSTAMFPITFRSLPALFRAGIALGMVCIILGLAPFAVAQDVHHELAAVDSDGHEHSDTDICQWVQHHSSGFLDLGEPVFSPWEIIGQYESPSTAVILSVESCSLGPPRAPPLI